MPRSLPFLACLLVTLASAMAACADADTPATANPFPERERVLIVHSYDDGFRWTAEQGEGIVAGLGAAGLREGIEYDLRTFFMDTRVRYTTPEQTGERADEAMAIIAEFQPAIVFLTDDVALRDVAVPYVEANPQTEVAFVFAGTNIDPSVYPPIASLSAPGGRITGLLERIPVAEAASALKRAFPDAATISLLADGSASSAAAVLDFDSTYPDGLHEPLEVNGFAQAATFAEWQDLVREADTNADIIGLLNYHGLTDDAGDVVAPAEVLEWTLDTASKPVVGLISDLARDGLPMAVGNSGFANGQAAAAIAVEILDGRDPGEIAIADAKLIETAFNLPAIDRLGLDVPEAEIEEAALVID